LSSIPRGSNEGSYNLITEKIDLQADTQNRFRTFKYNEGKVPGLIRQR